LEKDPSSEACRQGKEEAERKLASGGLDDNLNNPLLSGENDNYMKNMFANARNVARNHPKLKQYENDPGFNGLIFFVIFFFFYFVFILFCI
jgi:hypothetical protein